jgi:MtN3 and saliva related transmembrane protein
LNFTNLLGLVAGILTSSSLIPQLVKILKDKKVEDLSTGMFVTLMLGVALWIFYGIKRDDFPIIATNGFSLLLNITILILRFKYKKD